MSCLHCSRSAVSGQAANASVNEGESVSLEPDSLEPAPVSAGSKLPHPTAMGNVRSRSPVMEESEEVEVASTVSVIVPSVTKTCSVSILDQLAENVPWADDDTWLNQSETSKQDETDDAAPIVDDSVSTPFVDEDGVHYLEDGHFWVETAGLPPAEEATPPIPQIVTNGEPEPRRRNILVRFSTAPIRGLSIDLELVQPFI